jgi:DNA-directed RNA polymerase specialized sigma subunit
MKKVGVDYWDDLITAYKMLTHEEHVELARIRDTGTTTGQDGRKIFNRAAQEAIDKLCLHNLRMVAKQVCSMKCSDSTAIADLMAEGFGGLRDAAQRWQPIGTIGFAYVSKWYIRDPIIRHAKKFWDSQVSLDAQNDEGDDLYNAIPEASYERDTSIEIDMRLLQTLPFAQRVILEEKILKLSDASDVVLAKKAKLRKPMFVAHTLRKAMLALLDHAA